MNFKDLNLSAKILTTIERMGYEKPSEIQEMAIPKILERKDVIGLAQTGTGKTAAFSLPIIDNIIKEQYEGHDIKALVLCPTRELALQNKENIFKYTFGTDLRSMAVLGGVRLREQIKTIHKGIDILIATPGRLVDLMNQGQVNLSTVEVVVLDEADTMLDMGFIEDIRAILTRTPKSRQTLLFSATMPKEIMELTKNFMVDPITIKTKNVDVSIDKIDQELYYVDSNNKLNLLLDLISAKEEPTVLVFTRTKHTADKVSKALEDYGVKTSTIHSGKRQQSRAKALNDFKHGKTRILVATDIAARGIDINDLNLVINYDLPEQAESYVHRIGRTARAGKSGKAISFCSSGEVWFLKCIEKLINLHINVLENEKYPMVLKEERPGKKLKKLDKNKTFNHDNNDDEKVDNYKKEHNYKKRDNDHNDYKKKSYGEHKDYNKSYSHDDNRHDFKKKSYGEHKDYNKSYSHDDKHDFKKKSYGEHKDYNKSYSHDDKHDFKKKVYGEHKNYNKSYSHDDNKHDFKKKSYGEHKDYRKSYSHDNNNRHDFKKKTYGNNNHSSYHKQDKRISK